MEYTYDADKFIDVFEKSFTWLNGFMRNVSRFADKPALIDPAAEKTWTYKSLNEEANRLANALSAGGVGHNDLVLYQLMNSPQFAFCYIAPHKLGAVNSPANFNLAAGETAKILEHHKPKAYFYDCDMRAECQKALAISSYKPDIIVAVDYRGEKPVLPDGHVFYTDFVKEFGTEEPDSEFEQNVYSETTRLFTSGTTGLPKGVPVNNINEVLSAHDVMMHFPMGSQDITMNTTPWFHRGGLHSGGLTPSLYAGAACVIMRMFSAKSCLEYTEKYGVTFIIGVPSVLNNLAMRQEKHPTDLTKLKGIVTMGSPLEKSACVRYQQVLTPNIFNGYGTTESFWNSFLRPCDLPDMAGSAGRACTDDDVRVVNVYDDRKAEPDDTVPADGKTVGEIIIQSCAKCAMSYIDNEVLTKDKYYKGWMYTHDLGTWDENRFVFISGRRDDMIICMGENIYPTQVEEVLNECPGVKDCIVTGVPDKSRGEAVAAYIVPENDSLTPQMLNKFCVEHNDLSVYKCPRYYAFVDSVPYNATGKKQHFIVKKQAENDIKTGVLVRP